MCWRCFYSVSKWVTKICKFIGLVSSLHIDFYFAIYSGSIRLPFWVSMEKHCHSVLEFSNEFCLCEHRVHLPGSEVCEEVGIYKTVGPNTVMCESIDNKLLSWIVRNIGQYIILARRVLMCTSWSTTLAYATRGRSIFVSTVGTNGILLMPAHFNIPWVTCWSTNIFIQWLRANSYSV